MMVNSQGYVVHGKFGTRLWYKNPQHQCILDKSRDLFLVKAIGRGSWGISFISDLILPARFQGTYIRLKVEEVARPRHPQRTQRHTPRTSHNSFPMELPPQDAFKFTQYGQRTKKVPA